MFGAVFYPQAVRSTPTDMALSFQVFIKQFLPNIKTVYLYSISGLVLFAVSVKIFLLRKSNIVMKVFLMTFAMGYFMHLSFFNQYYFVALFYFFALMIQQTSPQKDTKDPRLNPLNTNLLIATDLNKEYESYGRGSLKNNCPKSCVHFKSKDFSSLIMMKGFRAK